MHVKKDKNSRRPVRVAIAKEVSSGYIRHDVFNRCKRVINFWRVVHRQNDPGKQLECKKKADKATIASIVA